MSNNKTVQATTSLKSILGLPTTEESAKRIQEIGSAYLKKAKLETKSIKLKLRTALANYDIGLLRIMRFKICIRGKKVATFTDFDYFANYADFLACKYNKFEWYIEDTTNLIVNFTYLEVSSDE